MAGFRQLQEAYKDASANIYRAFNGMGPEQHRQRGRIPKQNRLVSALCSYRDIILLMQPGVPFPKSFPSMIRQVFKRMYRVYAHIYCHHYPVVRELGLEAHLNTSFKHYVLFIDEHNLASGKDFWGPLGDLVDSMLRSD